MLSPFPPPPPPFHENPSPHPLPPFRCDVIENSRQIQAGDIIIGLSSSGPPAVYEEGGGGGARYNSGIGSNGLTSARHDVLSQEVGIKYPETFDPAIPSSLIYSGELAFFCRGGEKLVL